MLQGADKPRELLSASLVGGCFCETLGYEVGLAEREFDLFVMGTFYILDTLLGAETSLSPIHTVSLVQERGEYPPLSIFQRVRHLP